MTVTEKINKFIAENGGDTRDALVVAITRLDQMALALEAKDAEIREIQKAALNMLLDMTTDPTP